MYLLTMCLTACAIVTSMTFTGISSVDQVAFKYDHPNQCPHNYVCTMYLLTMCLTAYAIVTTKTFTGISSVDKVAFNTTTLINALITMFAECIYLPSV